MVRVDDVAILSHATESFSAVVLFCACVTMVIRQTIEIRISLFIYLLFIGYYQYIHTSRQTVHHFGCKIAKIVSDNRKIFLTFV